jgi:hypothetical protein
MGANGVIEGWFMRHIAGNLAIALGIVLIAATSLWGIVEIIGLPPNANEDQQGAAIAGVLFATALAVLGVVLCLTGRSLRQSPAIARAEEAEPPAKRLRPWPLALYLGGSVAIALFAAFIHRLPEFLRPLWLLVAQPFILTQLLLSGVFGLRFESAFAKQAVVTAVNLVYFPVLLYPLYRIRTMDRAAEPAGYRYMKTLLILFVSVHILIGMAFAILVRA